MRYTPPLIVCLMACLLACSARVDAPPAVGLPETADTPLAEQAAPDEQADPSDGESAERFNLLLHRFVTSQIDEHPAYCTAKGYTADQLTDGDTQTLAYPGAFSCDYALDLTIGMDIDPSGDPIVDGRYLSPGPFDINEVVIHWGYFGGHYRNGPDGVQWPADYVTRYRVEYRTAGTPDGQWATLYEHSGAPQDEASREEPIGCGIGLERIPRRFTVEAESQDDGRYTCGRCSTSIAGFYLSGVTHLRVRAWGGNWIGIYELEAYGRPTQGQGAGPTEQGVTPGIAEPDIADGGHDLPENPLREPINPNGEAWPERPEVEAGLRARPWARVTIHEADGTSWPVDHAIHLQWLRRDFGEADHVDASLRMYYDGEDSVSAPYAVVLLGPHNGLDCSEPPSLLIPLRAAGNGDAESATPRAFVEMIDQLRRMQ